MFILVTKIKSDDLTSAEKTLDAKIEATNNLRKKSVHHLKSNKLTLLSFHFNRCCIKF